MKIRKAHAFRTLILAAAVGGATATVALAGATSLTTEHTKDGKVIASTTGRAVYLFSSDTSSQSKCSGSCAHSWPPVTGSATAARNSGLNPKLLGTIKRSRGTQVTYDHHPLYLYAGDKSHTIKGEGAKAFGGHWYLIGPRGAAIKPKSSGCHPLCQGY